MPVYQLQPPSPNRLYSACAPWLALVLASAVLTGCVSRPEMQSEAAQPPPQTNPVPVEQARQAMRPSTVCSAMPGSPFALRKKVLVLALPVQRPIEAVDLPGLATAWSRALQQRLQDSDRFLVRNGNNHALDRTDNVRKQVISLAQLYDAQIVIAGQITSLGVRRGRIALGSLGTIPNPLGDLRIIETELEIFDGQSGARLKQLDHDTEVRGAVENPGNSVLRGDFFRTSLGEAVAKTLDRQVEDVQDELACLPMQARIVRTDLQDVHIDAGFTSNLKPGDRLRALQRSGFPSGEGGQIEKTVGTLVIKQVFPESAVGHIGGGEQPDWRFNGFVRAW